MRSSPEGQQHFTNHYSMPTLPQGRLQNWVDKASKPIEAHRIWKSNCPECKVGGRVPGCFLLAEGCHNFDGLGAVGFRKESFWSFEVKERLRQAIWDRVGYQSTLKYQRIVAKNVQAADLKKAYGYVILRPDDVFKNIFVEGSEASGVSFGHPSYYVSSI